MRDATEQERAEQVYTLSSLAQFLGIGAMPAEAAWRWFASREQLLRLTQDLLETHKSHAGTDEAAIRERIQALTTAAPVAPEPEKENPDTLECCPLCGMPTLTWLPDAGCWMCNECVRHVDEVVTYRKVATTEPWQAAALLPDRVRQAIRDRAQAGESHADLAEDYGVPQAFVEALTQAQIGIAQDALRALVDESIKANFDTLADALCDSESPVCPNHPDAEFVCPECALEESAALSAPSAPLAGTTCQWTEDDYGIWHTGCGTSFFFDTDGPEENKFHFCYQCGKPLTAIYPADPPAGPQQEQP